LPVLATLLALCGCTRPSYVIAGAGAASCADFAADLARRTPAVDAYAQWVAGYIVARQFSVSRPLSDAQIGGVQWKATLLDKLAEACRRNPQSTISETAAELSDRLLGFRQ
jgi:hypothetical protein